MNSNPKTSTIAEAARTALHNLGRPSSVKEIYDKIVELDLYAFNTPTPEHVLRTEIRRKTAEVERVDSQSAFWFRLTGEEIYDLMTGTLKKRVSIGSKRVQRASDKAEIIALMTSDASGSFKEIWRLLLFSAVLGFKSQRREPLSAVQSGEAIRQDVFANSPIWPGVLYLVGLAEKGNSEVLKGSEEEEDERVTIFEEYANGGLSVLKERFDSGVCSLDSLVEMLLDAATPMEISKPDLDVTI